LAIIIGKTDDQNAIKGEEKYRNWDHGKENVARKGHEEKDLAIMIEFCAELLEFGVKNDELTINWSPHSDPIKFIGNDEDTNDGPIQK
jgi:hypothetical protein